MSFGNFEESKKKSKLVFGKPAEVAALSKVLIAFFTLGLVKEFWVAT